jgi:integrase
MPRSRIPSYRHHKASGQAIVTIRTANGDRRDVYLGVYNSNESRAEYARLVAELATGASAEAVVNQPATPTVDEMLLAWWMWAENHYRREDGSQTNQLVEYKYTLKPLRKLYGHTKAKDFGPLALKTVREKMIEAQWCRNQINSRVGKIKRVFRWAASEQLIPVEVYTALATVAGLQRGRTRAPESEPIGPVDPAHVDATLPYLNRHVAGLVTFQRFTGCRPGEAVLLRRCDIDTSREVWFFTPATHKTKHKGKSRTIAIGPRAQALLAQFTTADHQAYLFDPRRAVEEHQRQRAANRRTPLYPSSIRRKKKQQVKSPKRKPAGRYTTHAFAVAVSRAVERANHVFVEAAVELELHVPHWHPNQLRHTFATEVRRRHGLESAGAALGHTKMSATETYAERDHSLAAKIAAEMG